MMTMILALVCVLIFFIYRDCVLPLSRHQIDQHISKLAPRRQQFVRNFVTSRQNRAIKITRLCLRAANQRADSQGY